VDHLIDGRRFGVRIGRSGRSAGLTEVHQVREVLGLIIHIAAFWPTSNPDVLAVMNVTAAKRRRDVVRDAVAALLA
jgi:hypothetical protein